MNFFRKIFGGPRRLETDMGDGSHADRTIAHPPFDLLTDGGAGPSRRLRVDVGQTGFFAGREFRTFREFDLSGTNSYTIKVESPHDFIVFALGIELLEGELRMETLSGGTPGGTFADVLPVRNRNEMASRPTPFYTPAIAITGGGTLTGGTLRDVLPAKSGGNANLSSSVGASISDERGLPAGTYYLRLTAAGGARGLFRMWWEERPA